ncbi:MAG: nucleotide exchange factor GrpE [Candidatus ainarchaeum sp.]|nr:nucleotide exchange factor GrpE [Candidatus ainarchaeum sp.]
MNKEKKDNNDSKKLLEEKDLKIIELTNDLKRVQAEFENFQKRSEKQNCEFKEFALTKMMEELLPVLDSLEVGIKHNPDFVQVYEQLFLILKKNGLEKLGVNVGDVFDHFSMECLMKESNEKLGNDRVAQILLVGYKFKGKILRPTKISINKIENEEKKNKNNEKIEQTKNEKVVNNENCFKGGN